MNCSLLKIFKLLFGQEILI